ncbi:Tripartite-type tricarboxylate transporter, receptor component TctC [Rhodospirillales bacterium URHD0017]|nr:Tripartite-type tricarboxylate transporter, receptor component TctC [Rhodospirillales bacterium URHD0017]
MKAIRILLFVGVLLGGGPVVAEPWPQKPVRAVVPYAAGSTTDIVPRVVFERLSAQLGQPIIVDNRAGAGGTIGAAVVAKAEADGYTILVNSSAHAIAPSLYPALEYDPAGAFAAVIPIGVSPAVLVVSPSSGFKTAAEFVAAARAKPGAFNFSSVGVGSATHLSAERFRLSAGIDAVHVPFKGGAEAMNEVVAGRIEFFFGPLGLVLPHVRDGKLTALVVNGTSRVAALPEVPTTQEAGFPDAEYPIWFGIFTPAATPRGIVDKLHRESARALQEPALRDKLTALGVEPLPMAPAAFDAFVKREIAVNGALVKAIGLKPN